MSRPPLEGVRILAVSQFGAGPFGTQVLANEMYTQKFVFFDNGRGSALAVILFLAVLPLMIYNVRQLRKEREVR